MTARGPDGRFVREEGLNINIGIFTIKIFNCSCCYISMVQINRKNRNPKNI